MSEVTDPTGHARAGGLVRLSGRPGMTLLVTGATGHVGGAVLRAAAARGRAVVALHRGGVPAAVDGVTWRRCDLGDAGAVAALAAEVPVDACIHLAAVSNEAYARPDPLGAFRANVAGTTQLLEAARVHGWRRFVLVSTGSVFQLRADTATPISEEEAPAPGNVYGTTKVAAELMAAMYRREYGVSAATVRISWVYGPPVASRSATRGPIPSFLVRALRGEPVREGGRDFAASFTHVDDVAAGLLAMAEVPELRHPVYHLGHGINFTAGAVAEAVRPACPGATIALGPGTEPWTRFTALRAPLAGTRLFQDTGFRPAIGLAAGIAAYADWLRARPEVWRDLAEDPVSSP